MSSKISYNCCICKKKINKMMISIYTCKCGNLYCNDHLNITEHNCDYDYKKAFSCKIKDTLPNVNFIKVEEI